VLSEADFFAALVDIQAGSLQGDSLLFSLVAHE